MLTFFRSFNKSELTLLVTSSFLIAIWPMRDTIAARNILLVVCTLISMFYLYRNFRTLVWSRKQSIKNWMPIILVALLFIWVLIHYFFFSYDPVAQLQELTSTWARSLMASIIGFTVGLIINRRKKGYGFIMLALISGLLILFYQYLVLVMKDGNVFQLMHWNSIYWGKINEVLIGTLFLSGAFAFFDTLLRDRLIEPDKLSARIFNWTKGCLYFLGILVVLHCYVFEIDTRNGIGIAVILTLIFTLIKSVRVVCNLLISHKKSPFWKPIFALSLMLLAVMFFWGQQVSRNTGWHTYLEDVKIASQVDKYPNWQTIPATPIFSGAGRPIPGNTYERTAWIVVAARTITDYPLGYGLIHNAFRHLMKLDYPNSDLTVSHSGWLDLGLSFGMIGLALAFGALLWTLVLGVLSNSTMAPIVLWSSLGLILAYALLEIVYYHGVEILMFWLIFLPALLLPKIQIK